MRITTVREVKKVIKPIKKVEKEIKKPVKIEEPVITTDDMTSIKEENIKVEE